MSNLKNVSSEALVAELRSRACWTDVLSLLFENDWRGENRKGQIGVNGCVPRGCTFMFEHNGYVVVSTVNGDNHGSRSLLTPTELTRLCSSCGGSRLQTSGHGYRPCHCSPVGQAAENAQRLKERTEMNAALDQLARALNDTMPDVMEKFARALKSVGPRRRRVRRSSADHGA